jgi:hypothetical protein
MFTCQDHCSGGSFGQRQQGRIRRSRSRQLPANTATDRRLSSRCSPTRQPPGPPPQSSPANAWWPRRWPSSPTAAASSGQRPAWTSGTGAFHGRTGSCLDNAVVESLFALKVELVDRQHSRTRTRAEAGASIFRCGGERLERPGVGGWKVGRQGRESGLLTPRPISKFSLYVLAPETGQVDRYGGQACRCERSRHEVESRSRTTVMTRTSRRVTRSPRAA